MERCAALAFVVIVAGCAGEDSKDSPPRELEPPSLQDTVGVTTRDLAAEMPVLLASTLAGTDSADELGTVRLLQSGESEGAMMITIELNTGRAGSHGWEIRAGDCAATTDSASTSPASRTTGVTGNIEVGAAGFGEGAAVVPASAVDAGEVGRSRYSLVVSGLQSPNAPEVIACADL